MDGWGLEIFSLCKMLGVEGMDEFGDMFYCYNIYNIYSTCISPCFASYI